MTTAGERPLRLGLIGPGRWGRNFITAISSLPDTRLAAVTRRRSRPRDNLPAGCTVMEDWRDILDESLVDGVVITTPAPLHFEMVSAAIARNVPVLVEKPLTLDASEAECLATEARRHGAIVMVDFIHLFNPSWGWMKAHLADIGPVESLVCRSGNRGPFRPDTPPLWDWAPHDLAMVLDLAGAPPTRFRARRALSEETREGFSEVVELALAFPGPIDARITTGNGLSGKHRHISIRGAGGEIVLDDVVQKGEVTSRGHTEVVTQPGGRTPPLVVVLRAFARAVRAGAAEQPDTLALALEITRLLSQITGTIGTHGVTDWRDVALPP